MVTYITYKPSIILNVIKTVHTYQSPAHQCASQFPWGLKQYNGRAWKVKG